MSQENADKVMRVLQAVSSMLLMEWKQKGDSYQLASFIYGQYRALPPYLRGAFLLFYTILSLKGFAVRPWHEQRSLWEKWKNSRFRGYREFARYHTVFVTFYLFSRNNEV
jgi:hypothetical protein